MKGSGLGLGIGGEFGISVIFHAKAAKGKWMVILTIDPNFGHPSTVGDLRLQKYEVIHFVDLCPNFGSCMVQASQGVFLKETWKSASTL